MTNQVLAFSWLLLRHEHGILVQAYVEVVHGAGERQRNDPKVLSVASQLPVPTQTHSPTHISPQCVQLSCTKSEVRK